MMENKMTPEEEEFALAEATKALPYLNNDPILDYCLRCGQNLNSDFHINHCSWSTDD